MSDDSLASFSAHEDDVAEYKATIANLQRQLTKARAKTDELVEAVQRGAKEAGLGYTSPPVTTPPRDLRKKGAEVALWHLTDWQGSKRTPSYNSQVMHDRVRKFVAKARHITEIQRADHPVKDGVVMFGGDMIEGLFNFPGQAWEIDSTLFTQWITVGNLIAETVEAALGIYETVNVFAEWGNHGRIGSKRDGVPRSDNFDRMCYEYARQMLLPKYGKRLGWQDCPEDIQRVQIGEYRALLIHGDEVGRNGFASPGTIVQHVNRWKSGSYPWDFRDVYIGHYHTHACWTMANGLGSVYQTGSTESENRYARDNLAAAAIPSQRLHFIDPVKGRVTSEYKVWLAEHLHGAPEPLDVA